MQVLVRDNNVDQALKALKKKMQREGIFREMKLRGHYEKPSRTQSAGEGGSDPPRPQAGAQAIAARGITAEQAQAHWPGRTWGGQDGRPPCPAVRLNRVSGRRIGPVFLRGAGIEARVIVLASRLIII